jgi:hypothetical protein
MADKLRYRIYDLSDPAYCGVGIAGLKFYAGQAVTFSEKIAKFCMSDEANQGLFSKGYRVEAEHINI